MNFILVPRITIQRPLSPRLTSRLHFGSFCEDDVVSDEIHAQYLKPPTYYIGDSISSCSFLFKYSQLFPNN